MDYLSTNGFLYTPNESLLSSLDNSEHIFPVYLSPDLSALYEYCKERLRVGDVDRLRLIQPTSSLVVTIKALALNEGGLMDAYGKPELLKEFYCSIVQEMRNVQKIVKGDQEGEIDLGDNVLVTEQEYEETKDYFTLEYDCLLSALVNNDQDYFDRDFTIYLEGVRFQGQVSVVAATACRMFALSSREIHALLSN